MASLLEQSQKQKNDNQHVSQVMDTICTLHLWHERTLVPLTNYALAYTTSFDLSLATHRASYIRDFVMLNRW